MKVVVLGAGVIGTSTAYYLARAGHAVTVVDRQPGPGLETSFANAGEISPGYSAPWAAPGLPLKAIKWLLMKYRPLVIRPVPDPALALWCLRVLRNCTAARYARNKSRMLLLADYSRDCLRSLRDETGIIYDGRAMGTLQLFREPEQLAKAGADIAVLEQAGIRHQLLDREGCVAAEPALGRVKGKIAGGVRLPDDETGDCHLFTMALADAAQKLGVVFRFGTVITRLVCSGDAIERVLLGQESISGDAYVVALGSYSPLLLNPLGIRIPVCPIKGYSLTFPICDESGAPQSTVMDETHKVAVTRLGARVRVGGMAELAGYDTRLRQAPRATLTHVVNDLFPGAGDAGKASFWTGLRPMTPDGPPVLGKSPLSNLYLSTGHGTLGWTMAAGSGQAVADLISGKIPQIDLSGMGMDR